MKILMVVMALTLAACGNDVYIEDAPEISETQHCNDMGGEMEMIESDGFLIYACTFDKHCEMAQCKSGAGDCPKICL